MSGKRSFGVLLHTTLFRVAAVAAVAVALVAVPSAIARGPGGGGGGGGGGEETTIGNNLSFPAIWSEGITLAMRGTFGDPQLLEPSEYTTGEGLPLYLQGVEANTWQAENVLAAARVEVSQVDWGDNIESRSLPLGKPIRVETTLLKDLDTPMQGFSMYSAYGSRDAEVFGTDGATYDSTQATIYSACARLTIQRLEISRDDPYTSALTWDPAAGEWTGTGLIAPAIFNGGVWSGGEGSGYSAEINGSGKVVYGYNWTGAGTAGDYRITFSLDPNCPTTSLNTFMTPSTTVYLTPTTEGSVAPAAEGGGAVATIDAADNLSYIDVEVGSPTYSPYEPPEPVNTGLPVISGTTTEGQVLTTSNGSWANEPTSYSYQWQSCDSTGAMCTAIPGASADSYTLTATDVGRTMRVAVTASNDNGDATATSAATSVVLPLPPVNTSPPTILGTAQPGQLLVATNGVWGNSPTSYTYQWRVCDAGGAACADIAGASTGTYALTAGLVGRTIRLVVTAANAGGSVPAASAATAVVAQPQQQQQQQQQQTQQRTHARVTLQLRWLKGERLQLWGSVYPAHDGKQLVIQKRMRTGWQRAALVRLQQATTERSRYTVKLGHTAPGFYRAYLAADTAHLASTSTTLRARARATVTLQLRHLTDHRLRLSGSVLPPRNGEKLTIQLRTRGTWKTVAKVRLHQATRYRSRYTITLRHHKAGAYRTHLSGTAAYRPSNSRTARVR